MDRSHRFADPRFGPVVVTEGERGWTVEVAGGVLALDSPTGELAGADGGGTAWSGRELFLRRTFDGHAQVGDYAITLPPGTPDATDARVGHLLAAAWGVGARGAVYRTGEALLPGLWS